MEIPLLKEIVIIFCLAIVVILGCHKLKLPTIVGFLITGVLGGPHGFGFINNVEDVDMLATIGIVMLLFAVGMEFSFKKILEYKRFFLIGGVLQVLFTVLAGLVVGLLIGRPIGESIFLGFLLSLSSTAIVLRVLDEKGETDTPHGRLIIGVMIFQDIIAIPMMLFTPLLGGGGGEVSGDFLLTLGKGLLILVVVLIAANKIVPKMLYYIAKTRSRELFLLSVLTVCFSVAWLTSYVGLSLSLGAFLAGLIVSESEYRNEAVGDILPFQDIFVSFFFISIGMLLNTSFVLAQPFTIVFIAAGILLIKTFAAGLATLILGMPIRTAILAGIALSQIGEFSFVLAKNGINYGLADDYRYQLFLAVSLLTMAVTPTLMNFSSPIADIFMKLPLPMMFKTGMKPQVHKVKEAHHNHVLIVGFGLVGRNLARAAKEADVSYVILEMNPETVKLEKKKGEPIHFGDATHATVLHHANIENARVAAIVINDFTASLRIVETIRRLNPNIYIMVRTRYVEQMKAMYQLGADDVVPDEFGSSIEIFTRVMSLYQITAQKMDKVVTDIRTEAYDKLRLLYKNPQQLYDKKTSLSDLGIESYVVHTASTVAGKTLSEIALRKEFGVTVIAIKRENKTISNIDAQTVILQNDVLTVTGEPTNVTKASKLFNAANT